MAEPQVHQSEQGLVTVLPINVTDNLYKHFKQLGLEIDHSFEEYDAAIKHLTKLNLSKAWNMALSRFMKERHLENHRFAENKLLEEISVHFGWKSASNMRSYLNVQVGKCPGAQVVTDLAAFLKVEPSDINPELNSRSLQEHRASFYKNAQKKRKEHRLLIAANFTREWQSYAKRERITQEQFCKKHFKEISQSQFSSWLTGKVAIKEKYVIAVSMIFDCDPSDIDPNLKCNVVTLLEMMVEIVKGKDLSAVEKQKLSVVQKIINSKRA